MTQQKQNAAFIAATQRAKDPTRTPNTIAQMSHSPMVYEIPRLGDQLVGNKVTEHLNVTQFQTLQRQSFISNVGQFSGNGYVTRILLSRSTNLPCYTVQRDRTAQDIETNVMDLTETTKQVPTGRGRRTRKVYTLDERSTRRIQQRLIELRLLREDIPGFQWGELNEITQDAQYLRH